MLLENSSFDSWKIKSDSLEKYENLVWDKTNLILSKSCICYQFSSREFLRNKIMIARLSEGVLFFYISIVNSMWRFMPVSSFSLGQSHRFWKLTSVVVLGRKFFSEDSESSCLWLNETTSKVEIWKILWRLKRSQCFYLENSLDTVKVTENLVTVFLSVIYIFNSNSIWMEGL